MIKVITSSRCIYCAVCNPLLLFIIKLIQKWWCLYRMICRYMQNLDGRDGFLEELGDISKFLFISRVNKTTISFKSDVVTHGLELFS